MNRLKARARARQRGMTLVEVLVAAAVVGLLLLITDRLLASVHRTARTSQLAVDVQQNARVAVSRLRREVRESRATAVTCYPDPTCRSDSTQITFPSARPSDAASIFCIDVAPTDRQSSTLQSACGTPIPLTGTYGPVWQRYVAYHRTATGELRRLAQGTPVTLPLAPGSGQVLAGAIESFTVSLVGLTVRLGLRSRGQDAIQGEQCPSRR